jgi:hypothetical protein
VELYLHSTICLHVRICKYIAHIFSYMIDLDYVIGRTTLVSVGLVKAVSAPSTFRILLKIPCMQFCLRRRSS